MQPFVTSSPQNVRGESPDIINIKSDNKSKCGKCRKNMPGHLKVINCDVCENYYHVKCSGTSKKSFLEQKRLCRTWICSRCTSNTSYSHLDNNELYLEINNVSLPSSETSISMPSYTIQSLLDQMPEQNFETDEFMSETITSKYFTPSQFLESKLSANKFSMLHINIASLSKHIDELRSLIKVLDHPFDIIGITVTRLYEDTPLVNIEIDGYVFKHTATKTRCRGTGMYIKSCYDFDVIPNLSSSNLNVSESLFIEINMEGLKNIIIGCIDRHHSPIPTFLNSFFKDALEEVSTYPNKICALMGDFNIDLIKYSSSANTTEFYDLLCSQSFRPLNHQPSRETSKSATLIDNVFINDITCHSLGGNLTSSISDHFLQFSQIDNLETCATRKNVKYARDYRNFNKRGFNEKLNSTDWGKLVNDLNGTNESYKQFYDRIEDVLNHVDPYRKLRQKEIRVEQRPWITKGLLVSMKIRDDLSKRRAREKNLNSKVGLLINISCIVI